MLPVIPVAMSIIDDYTRKQHYLLERGDDCAYVWEYVRRRGFASSAANSLINNLKKKPSTFAAHPRHLRHKSMAIAHAARALKGLLSAEWVESKITFVPVPCSKNALHIDYDDRLERVLRIAFDGSRADIRRLLVQIRDTPADHECRARQRRKDLCALLRVEECSAQPTRPYIFVFDDVLNSGKHFKVAQSLLARRFPQARIRGLFLARCVVPMDGA
jgi:hypothetical protein